MAKYKMHVLAVGFFALVFTGVITPRFARGDIGEQAHSINLDQVRAQYESYEEYEDTGTLTVNYYQNGQLIRTSAVKFSTTFDRSGDFQINWQDILRNGEGGLAYKIWSTDGIVFSKYGFDTAFQSASLHDALSRAVGISNSLTFYTPCLLMPDMKCFLCDNGVKFTTQYHDSADGDVQRIDIEYQSGNIETFWVNKETNQITKIEWWNEMDGLRVHHQVAYTAIEVK